jgi:ketosteroid isomerase-like protein
MRKAKFTMIRLITMLVVLIFISGCERNTKENELNRETDLSTLEKEIELRLREYESHLQNGDSIALGNMYMEDAEIIPSTVGRENIIKGFGSMIRDSITGSSFKTTKLWGNDQLLVEDGTGTWSHTNGKVVGSGRYLLVWKKDDGKWKILRDTWFPDKKK